MTEEKQLVLLGDKVYDWLTGAGFHSDSSALSAAIHDVHVSAEKIAKTLVPALLATQPGPSEDSVEALTDLLMEFEHLRSHAEEAGGVIAAARDLLDKSPRSAPRESD